MHRLKTSFGARLKARRVDSQVAEVDDRVPAMSTMTWLGMPKAQPLLTNGRPLVQSAPPLICAITPHSTACPYPSLRQL